MIHWLPAILWLVVVAALVFLASVVYGYRRPTRTDGLLTDAELAQARATREDRALSSATATHQPTTSRGHRGVSPTASGGGLGSGLLAVGGGLFLHSHYGPIKQVCQSGIGALGQTLEPHSQSYCTLASFLTELGTIMTISGSVIVVMTVVLVLVLLFDAHKQTS